MALRKVFEGRHHSRRVKVFRDPLWDEYVAKVYRLNRLDGTWGCKGEYRTGDKRDALVTASAMLLDDTEPGPVRKDAPRGHRLGVFLSMED